MIIFNLVTFVFEMTAHCTYTRLIFSLLLRISIGTLKLCLIGSLILFVLIPFIFKYSTWLQQGILFLTFSKYGFRKIGIQINCVLLLGLFLKIFLEQLRIHRIRCLNHRKALDCMQHEIFILHTVIPTMSRTFKLAYGTFCPITFQKSFRKS